MSADDYAWPEVTRAQLLAALTATGKADDAERLARLLTCGHLDPDGCGCDR